MQTGPPSNGGGGNIAGLMQVPMSPDFGAPPRFNIRHQGGGGANGGGGPNGVASWNPRNVRYAMRRTRVFAFVPSGILKDAP